MAFTVLAGATGYFVCQIAAALLGWQATAMLLLAACAWWNLRPRWTRFASWKQRPITKLN